MPKSPRATDATLKALEVLREGTAAADGPALERRGPCRNPPRKRVSAKRGALRPRAEGRDLRPSLGHRSRLWRVRGTARPACPTSSGRAVERRLRLHLAARRVRVLRRGRLPRGGRDRQLEGRAEARDCAGGGPASCVRGNLCRARTGDSHTRSTTSSWQRSETTPSTSRGRDQTRRSRFQRTSDQRSVYLVALP